MATMTKQVRPSERAYEAVRKMARDAAKNDNWMVPCPEEHVDTGCVDNLGEISQRHRDGWQETCHFDHYYGQKLSDMTDVQERRFVAYAGDSLTWETRYYALYQELLDAFWDEWEEKSGFYEKAEEACDRVRAGMKIGRRSRN